MRKRWSKWHGEDFDKAFGETYERIAEGGAVLAREIKQADHKSGGWWQWHPSKKALEFFWHTGKLAISARQNFQKVYDLAERVIPARHLTAEVSHAEFIDWACLSALERLGFATHGEIAAFWDLVSPEEAKDWVAVNRDRLQEVEIECEGAGRPRASFALAGFSADPEAWPEPPGSTTRRLF